MFDQTEVGPLIENFDGDSTMRQIAQESISCMMEAHTYVAYLVLRVGNS